MRAGEIGRCVSSGISQSSIDYKGLRACVFQWEASVAFLYGILKMLVQCYCLASLILIPESFAQMYSIILSDNVSCESF